MCVLWCGVLMWAPLCIGIVCFLLLFSTTKGPEDIPAASTVELTSRHTDVPLASSVTRKHRWWSCSCSFICCSHTRTHWWYRNSYSKNMLRIHICWNNSPVSLSLKSSWPFPQLPVAEVALINGREEEVNEQGLNTLGDFVDQFCITGVKQTLIQWVSVSISKS